jgi:peptidyl-prolyl cis-trans isomerase SurA
MLGSLMKKKMGMLLSLALLLPLAAQGQTIVEEIIARVNSDIITRSELTRSRQLLYQELQQEHGPRADQMLAEREHNLLRDLIDQQLLVQRARDLGLNVDTEVIRRLDQMRQDMGLDSMEALESAARQQGVEFEDFKEQMRNSILTQQVIGREVGGQIQITNEEVRQYFEEHKADFDRPERVRLSEILIAATPGQDVDGNELPADAASLEAAEARARELLAEIRQGAEFEAVARQHSSGPTAAQGGDLGYFERGTLARELEDLTFTELKPGQVSDVVRTRQGYIILKVTDYNQAGVPALKEIERQIQEAIYLRKLQPAMREHLTKLREQAYIDIKDGFLDTGASPNQTKPIFTAARDREEPEQKRRRRFILF